MRRPSDIDDAQMKQARAFRMECFDDPHIKGRVLEIGPDPEHREGRHDWETLDILPGCTYQEDLCQPGLAGYHWQDIYHTVLCMEVLEHCLNPQGALQNIRTLLRPDGWLIGSTPLNARIHGPLPDCWRFTVHGLRVLLKDWDEVTITPLESDRFLFPINYRWRARCNKTANRDPRSFRWEMLE